MMDVELRSIFTEELTRFSVELTDQYEGGFLIISDQFMDEKYDNFNDNEIKDIFQIDVDEYRNKFIKMLSPNK